MNNDENRLSRPSGRPAVWSFTRNNDENCRAAPSGRPNRGRPSGRPSGPREGLGDLPGGRPSSVLPLDSGLLQTRTIEWPTVALFAGSYALWATAVYAGVAGWVSTVPAVLAATVAAYAAFTPMHEAAHRSLARSALLNGVLGRLSGLLLVAPFLAVRHFHLEHHKTHERGRSGSRLLEWARPVVRPAAPLGDTGSPLLLSIFALLPRAKRAERIETVASLAAMLALVTLAFGLGYGQLALLYWILPARLAIFFLAFAFDYLPHYPHEITAAPGPVQRDARGRQRAVQRAALRADVSPDPSPLPGRAVLPPPDRVEAPARGAHEAPLGEPPPPRAPVAPDHGGQPRRAAGAHDPDGPPPAGRGRARRHLIRAAPRPRRYPPPAPSPVTSPAERRSPAQETGPDRRFRRASALRCAEHRKRRGGPVSEAGARRSTLEARAAAGAKRSRRQQGPPGRAAPPSRRGGRARRWTRRGATRTRRAVARSCRAPGSRRAP